MPVYLLMALLAWLAVAVAATEPALAQSGIAIAPSLGYEFGTPLLLRRDSGTVNQLGVDGNGVSQAHTLWIGAELHHDSLLGNGWRWSFGGAIAPSISSFTSNPFNAASIDTANASITPTTRRFSVHGTAALAELSTHIALPIGGAHRLRLGLWGTWRFAADLAITEELLSPDSITFAGGQRSRSVPLLPGAITAPVHAGFDAAIQFHLPIGYGLRLSPTFGLRLDAAAIANGLGLRSLSTLIGVSVVSAASALPQPSARLDSLLVPTSPPPSPPPTPRITATVGLFANAGNQRQHVAHVVLYRVHYRSVMPLLPVVFFEHGQSQLPGRYRQISKAASVAFGNATLAGLDSIQVYHHLLNIVGQRLRQNKTSTLRLTGYATAEEPSYLASERAQRVQEYLASVWDIERSRVVIQRMKGQAIPNFSGVMLHTEEAALMAPVLWEWIVRRMAAPGVGIEQEIVAAAGVQDWRLTIRQQDRQLLHRSLHSSDTISASASRLITLQNLGEREANEPLVATLRAIDSLGEEAIATDTLRVEIVAEADTNHVATVITTGTLFSANGFLALDEGNEGVLRQVLADLRPGNRVVVGEREIEIESQVAKAISTAVGTSLAAEQRQSVEKARWTEEWFFSNSIGLRVER